MSSGIRTQSLYGNYILRHQLGDFPGGSVAKTPCSQCRGPGLDPAWGTRSHVMQLKIPHPACCMEEWRSCVMQLRPRATK